MNVNYYRGNDRHPDNIALAKFFKELTGMHFYDSIVVMDKNVRKEQILVTSTPI